MKTQILKMMALTVTAFVVIIITSSKKTKAAEKNIVVTEFKDVRNIHKISIMGNVELHLTQGTRENLKVHNAYYSKNALVQWENGELRISSFENEKLTVHITVTNLTALEASGESTVATTNQLSAVDLDIQLKDNATAKVQAAAINISSTLSGKAQLDIEGESINQHIGLSGAAGYQASNFDTQNRSMLITNNAVATISQQGQSTQIKAVTNIPEQEDVMAFEPVL